MTKIRISAHSLAIEVGRYNKTPIEARFCQHCASEIENEIHFILKCPKYNTLRQGTYSNLFDETKNDADLIREIVNPNNPILSKSICKFIQEANMLRKQLDMN